MIPPFVILTVLALLLCASAVTLWLDSRERRMDRQLTNALPASHSAGLTSIRRSETGSRSQLIHRLANYRPEVVYVWHPAYTVLAGALAAIAVVYVNRLVQFSAPWCLSRLQLSPSWWCEVCLDGSNIGSPISFSTAA